MSARSCAGGIWWLLRVSCYRRLPRLMLILGWLSSVAVYIWRAG
jgi:hypothetical protein